jgi:hypothetical protein
MRKHVHRHVHPNQFLVGDMVVGRVFFDKECWYVEKWKPSDRWRVERVYPCTARDKTHVNDMGCFDNVTTYVVNR